jgi:hypothetical protein
MMRKSSARIAASVLAAAIGASALARAQQTAEELAAFFVDKGPAMIASVEGAPLTSVYFWKNCRIGLKSDATPAALIVFEGDVSQLYAIPVPDDSAKFYVMGFLAQLISKIERSGPNPMGMRPIESKATAILLEARESASVKPLMEALNKLSEQCGRPADWRTPGAN